MNVSSFLNQTVMGSAHYVPVRILIVSDAGAPQVNGVVSTLAQTAAWLRRFNHDVQLLTPAEFRTVACPTYPEIRLVFRPCSGIKQKLRQFQPHVIHIATEGPLGVAARRLCKRRRLKFTTSYHTQFPQYIRARFPVPLPITYFLLRWFHGAAQRCMVSTRALHEELHSRGFKNLAHWGRGVDTERFQPRESLLNFPRPVAIYAGRVSVEKNVAAFLRMPWSGTKVVIGDGPGRAALQAGFPEAHFLGFRFGDDFARLLASADVFVFPSRTDTFGLVLLEALACGVPVAAYPVTGPIDVIEDGVTGVLDQDLHDASLRALLIDRSMCRARALRSSWETSTRQFENNLVPCDAAAEKSISHPGRSARKKPT